MKKLLSLVVCLAFTFVLYSQKADTLFNNKFNHLFSIPHNYVIAHTSVEPIIDGDIDENVWKKTAWTNYFVDIEGEVKPAPFYKTRVKMLWDTSYLYIAAELEDEHVWANLKRRDEVIFFDNDFEVFIDPTNSTHQYFEIEINALNTIFDLFLPKPYRAGSGALIPWGGDGLKHAVKIYGSLNDASDKDLGWTIEMAIPFRDITVGNNPICPKDGDIWRLNFSRVQWETEVINGEYLKKVDSKQQVYPEYNWVWSKQGIIDMHLPERWGYIQFSKEEVGSDLPQFMLPYSEYQRKWLWLIYYTQKEYKSVHGVYAQSLDQLNINSTPIVRGRNNNLKLEASSNQFEAIISDCSMKLSISINQDGYIYVLP